MLEILFCAFLVCACLVALAAVFGIIVETMR